jgi:hypothetical protein
MRSSLYELHCRVLPQTLSSSNCVQSVSGYGVTNDNWSTSVRYFPQEPDRGHCVAFCVYFHDHSAMVCTSISSRSQSNQWNLWSGSLATRSISLFLVVLPYWDVIRSSHTNNLNGVSIQALLKFTIYVPSCEDVSHDHLVTVPSKSTRAL